MRWTRRIGEVSWSPPFIYNITDERRMGCRIPKLTSMFIG